MNPPYRANNTGTYIRKDVFEAKHIKTFTLKNLKKMNELRLGNIWRAKKMPDTIKCYTEDSGVDGYVKVPGGIRSYIPEQFVFEYNYPDIEFPQSTITLHDYQEVVVNQLESAGTGLIKSGAWSGKTIIIIEWIRRLKRKTLIVMKDLSLMSQMVSDIEWFLWITPTQISGTKVSKKVLDTWDDRITVVSIESRDKISEKELRSFWTIFFDEAHTYFSDARMQWLGNVSPQYLFWLTATPKVNHMEDAIFKLYFWKEITTEWIQIHVPNYNQVLSDFNYYLDDIKEFHKLKEAMYTAEKRNTLIVNTVVKNIKWRKWLVFCEHVAHARTLEAMLIEKWLKTYLMIGEVSKEDRETIRSEVIGYQWDCVIVWSVQIIGTGFNIPELSFAILTTPIKFTTSVEQFVGRLSRVHPSKPQAEFYEVTDHMVWILNNQSKSRLRTYKQTYPTGKIKICN